jgi:hypothetical protein
MLFALLSVFALAAGARVALAVHRLWRAIPRRNSDFGVV